MLKYVKFNKYFGQKDVVEVDNGTTISYEVEENNGISLNGYNSYINCYTNNLHQLQKQNINLIGGKEAIKLKVNFCDFYMIAFPTKKVNYRFWKAHLKKVGAGIVFCNHHLTPEQIKNSLFKVFQRNIDLPKKVATVSYYLWLGIELDEIVSYCINTTNKPKEISKKNKILYNPNLELTGRERKNISGRLAKIKLKTSA